MGIIPQMDSLRRKSMQFSIKVHIRRRLEGNIPFSFEFLKSRLHPRMILKNIIRVLGN